jgi:hypothetical protein
MAIAWSDLMESSLSATSNRAASPAVDLATVVVDRPLCWRATKLFFYVVAR